VSLGFAQFTHHRLLLLLLDLEVLMEGLHVRHQPLVRIRNVLGLALDALLECFKDVRLHVVRMELGLSFFIFLELRAHVFSNLLLLELHLLDNCIIVSLLRLIVFLDISHAGAECSEFLDAWRQLGFLLLYLLFNLLNECGQFL